MGSLTDVFSYDELRDFIEKTDEEIGGSSSYSVEPKIDGLSVSLTYRMVFLLRARHAATDLLARM